MRFESLKIPKDLLKQVQLLWALFRDPRTPRTFKGGVWFLFLYLLMPIDIIPDFIPVIGQLDDLLIVVIGLKLLARLCPPELVQEHKNRLGLPA